MNEAVCTLNVTEVLVQTYRHGYVMSGESKSEVIEGYASYGVVYRIRNDQICRPGAETLRQGF